jgi:hypothetical protein
MLHDAGISTVEALDRAAYALKCIEEVGMRRKNESALATCNNVRVELARFSRVDGVQFRKILQMVTRLSSVASDLQSAIRFELHEVLVPFLEVKRPTHKFGKQMFADYFRWLPENSDYSPEQIVAALERDLERLTVAFEHLEKAKHPRRITRGH